MRKKLVVGNWKMHGQLQHNQQLLTTLRDQLSSLRGADTVICVPHPYLFQAQQLLQGSNIAWGGQHVSRFKHGAYTGSVSADMLADFGCSHAIIGHSERRVFMHETNVTAASSFGVAMEAGLTPIFCVGETADERQQGLNERVVENQLAAILQTLGMQAFSQAVQLRAVIAYEPVWAIGTGHSATPEQAQHMHAFIRNRIADYDKNVAERVRIIYGGSVKSINARQLLVMPDIDGALVGAASLDASEFVEICAIADDVSSH